MQWRVKSRDAVHIDDKNYDKKESNFNTSGYALRNE